MFNNLYLKQIFVSKSEVVEPPIPTGSGVYNIYSEILRSPKT